MAKREAVDCDLRGRKDLPEGDRMALNFRLPSVYSESSEWVSPYLCLSCAKETLYELWLLLDPDIRRGWAQAHQLEPERFVDDAALRARIRTAKILLNEETDAAANQRSSQ